MLGLDNLNIIDATASSLGKMMAISYLKEATTPIIVIMDTNNWYFPKSEMENMLVMMGRVSSPTALATTVLNESFSTFFENSDKFRNPAGIIIQNKTNFY